MPAIKSAMFRYNGAARPLGVLDRAPVDHQALHRRIQETFAHCYTERWSTLGPLLPDLIADGWHAAHVTTGQDAGGRRATVSRGRVPAARVGVRALMRKGAVGSASLHDHTAVRDYLGE